MRLIDNLEELEIGDYISRSFSRIGDTIIFEIKVATKELLKVKAVKYSREHWNRPNQWVACLGDGFTVINKRVRKTKKRKLKHKLVTYNREWTIFKLTEKEKSKVIREMILKKLIQ